MSNTALIADRLLTTLVILQIGAVLGMIFSQLRPSTLLVVVLSCVSLNFFLAALSLFG